MKSLNESILKSFKDAFLLESQTAEERFIQAGFKKNVNGEFDIDGDFNLNEHKYLIVGGKLAVKFGKVSGDFYCYSSDLTSLEGCPKEVGGNFDCSVCEKLTSLEGCPSEVGGEFYCYGCKNLTSLKGCPEKVGVDFWCAHCVNLTSLEGCPKEVGRGFDCSRCKNLTSLEWCPEKVKEDFDCSGCNNLKNLKGCPEKVGGNFYCIECGIRFTEDEVRSLCDVNGKIVC